MQVQTARDNYEVALTMQKILHANDAVMSAHLLLGIAGCELRLDHAAAAERLARQVLAGSLYTPQRVGLGVLALARSRLGDRKSVVLGKSVSVRVDLGGRRIIKKTKSNKGSTNTIK